MVVAGSTAHLPLGTDKEKPSKQMNAATENDPVVPKHVEMTRTTTPRSTQGSTAHNSDELVDAPQCGRIDMVGRVEVIIELAATTPHRSPKCRMHFDLHRRARQSHCGEVRVSQFCKNESR